MKQTNCWRGKRMREAMNRRHLSSGQVATRMGVTSGAVRQWTTGRSEISSGQLERFAEIVGYPIEYFFRQTSVLTAELRDLALDDKLGELLDEVKELRKEYAAARGNTKGRKRLPATVAQEEPEKELVAR